MSAVATAIPVLPDIAWRGLAGRYRHVVSPCTEAPEVFHLGSFIAAVGCVIGRRAWVRTPHPVYPNFYCLLIGKTAHARKSTAYQFGMKLCDHLGELDSTFEVKQLHGLASAEGLAKAMQGSGTALAVEDEFRSLLTKGGNRANLISKVTELFGCPPRFEVNTKKDPIVVEEPFLGILAASTRVWFEQSLTHRDVGGGFLNRWLVFEGESDKILPSPPAVDLGAWQDLVIDLACAIENCDGEYGLSPEAEKFYRDFYTESRTEFSSEETVRTDLHAKKLGLFYAVLAGRGDRIIHLEDIESGAPVAKYCARVVEPLAASIDQSRQRRLEERVLEYVAQHPGIEKRELYRALHVSAGELESVLGPLMALEIIVEKDGRYYPVTLSHLSPCHNEAEEVMLT